MQIKKIDKIDETSLEDFKEILEKHRITVKKEGDKLKINIGDGIFLKRVSEKIHNKTVRYRVIRFSKNTKTINPRSYGFDAKLGKEGIEIMPL